MGAALLLSISGALALEISEVCSANKTAYLTPAGESPDWVELRSGEGEVPSLAGWYLSDDEDEPRLFSLEGCSVGPEGYLVLRADRKELPFKLSSSGGSLYLSDGSDLRQEVAFPPLEGDQSYSLQPDGAWHVTQATPGEENAAGRPYVEPPFVAPPKFSHTAGFFDASFDLTLTGYGDARVYYTTDGSIPDESSTLYTGPLRMENRSGDPNVWSAREDIMLNDLASDPPNFLVDKCNIIRAVAVDAAGNKSKVATNTYFVGLAYDSISVLSIVADPYALFDENDGIYVLGKIYYDWLNDPEQDHDVIDYKKPTNFGKTNPLSSKEREIPADLQLFDPSGNVALNQTLAIRIQGNYSRMRPQKSFKVTARKEISGDNKIDIRLWDGLPKAKQLIVRADGNMTSAPSVDALAHMFVSDQEQIYSRATPTIVFLDGEYWGLYNLRPSGDARYISDYTGIPEDELIVIKNNHFEAGAEHVPELRSLHTLLRQIGQMDLSRTEEYEKLCAMIDVNSFIRFTVANLYLQNHDLSDVQNVTVWRTVQQDGPGLRDGRWRWMYQDMDLTCDAGYETKVFNEILPNLQLLHDLWKNEDFQKQFLNTLADFINVDCSESRVRQCLNRYSALYGPYILGNQLRFSSFQKRSTEQMTELIKVFFAHERKTFLTSFSAAMDMKMPVYRLTADFSGIPSAGLCVNQRNAPYLNGVWTGQYFEGQELTLSVSDVPTYAFQGWYEGDTLLSAEKEVTLTVTGDRTVTPRYRALPRLLELNDKKNAFIRRKEVNIPSSDYAVAASLTADGGLALSAGALVRLSADSKWPAGSGLTLKWNTDQYMDLRLFFTAGTEGDAPSKWKLLWSLDGESWDTLSSFKLDGEKTALSFALPADMDDAVRTYLRIVSDKKGKNGSLVLEDLALCAEKLPLSLALIKNYAARCRTLAGDGFEGPDIKALAGASSSVILEVERELKSRLLLLLIGRTQSTAGKRFPDAPQLSLYRNCPVYEITDEICSVGNRAKVPSGGLADGACYLYRWENGRLRLEDAGEIVNGQYDMALSPGVFVLTKEKFDDVAYRAEFSAELLDAALVDGALGGMYPYGIYLLNVTVAAPGVESVAVKALPDGAVWMELWTYRIEADHTLSFLGIAQRNGDWTYDLPCAGTGSYLLMTQPLEDHLDEAETLRERMQGR